MSNQVRNTLELSGDESQIRKFIESVDDGENRLNFNQILPMPEGLSSDDSCEWAGENWGTKWQAYDVESWNNNSLRFVTANGAPYPFLIQASKMFPDVLFFLGFSIEMDYDYYTIKIKNGEVLDAQREINEEFRKLMEG